eukprot:265944_1
MGSTYFAIRLLLLFIVIVASTDRSQENAKDFIGSAINGYAALLDRMGKIYQILSESNTYDPQQQDFFQRNRRKIERSILRGDNEQEVMDELMTHYDDLLSHKPKQRAAPTESDPYYIPIIDDILGLNPDIEAEPLRRDHKNKQKNAQFEYVRRRLKEETHQDIVCNNTKHDTYHTDYTFKFEPFSNCTTSLNDSILNTVGDITTINVTNQPILYSSNCEFMLILNESVRSLQVMASQQIHPWWSSGHTNSIKTSALSMVFNSNNGSLQVYDGDTVTWSNTDSALWNNDTLTAPYSLVLSNRLARLSVLDSNKYAKWHSQNAPQTNINTREHLYRVDLTDGDSGDVLYSMSMVVFLILHQQQIFELEFVYITDDEIQDSDQPYVDIMTNMVYKFNVSVFELSSHSLGDTYVVFDRDLPMIYSLIHKQPRTLSIAESHTFLCIDNATRYFNVEVEPFAYEIEDYNYTFIMYSENHNESNISNYTFSVDPWNPCNDGVPVLAQKVNRECFITYDIPSAISEFDEYSSNPAYSNVNMKYVGLLESTASAQCVKDILSGNQTHNITDIFPRNFSSDLCTNYVENATLNAYFNSTYCDLLRTHCVDTDDGYYDICLDFTHKMCTCYCPRDKKGAHCDEYREYDCKLNILSANMTECEAMTQDELNAHGRSDYDVTLDGDKPCFFITDRIESVIQLSCYFMDVDSPSQVWETLSDYVISYDNITFDYCLGNETSSFALTSAPPTSYLRIKLFNFARIFSDNETSHIPLDINHWSGDRYVVHNVSMSDLHSDYKIGGRVYIEYQLWHKGNGDSVDRMNVERRFYDIDHWVMPMSDDAKFDSAQKWFIVISSITVLVLTVYCIAQCNKWCKKLEHEKND